MDTITNTDTVKIKIKVNLKVDPEQCLSQHPMGVVLGAAEWVKDKNYLDRHSHLTKTFYIEKNPYDTENF